MTEYDFIPTVAERKLLDGHASTAKNDLMFLGYISNEFPVEIAVRFYRSGDVSCFLMEVAVNTAGFVTPLTAVIQIDPELKSSRIARVYHKVVVEV